MLPLFQYKLILYGEDIIAVGRDMVKYLFTRHKSRRMRRFIYKFKSHYYYNKKRWLFRPRRVPNPIWLRRPIFATTTWFDDPHKYEYYGDD